MHSNETTLGRRVTVRDLGHICVFEVEGELDLIGGYDRRRAFTAVLRGSSGAVALDLSSVTAGRPAASSHGPHAATRWFVTWTHNWRPQPTPIAPIEDWCVGPLENSA